LSDTFVILLIDFVSLTLTHTVSVSAFGRTTIHAMKRRNRDLTGGCQRVIAAHQPEHSP
jgi:hypothetical protein